MSEDNYTKLRAAYLAAYQQALGLVEALLGVGKLERALRHAEYAASIAWHRPILAEFVDERLEGLVDTIASKLVQTHLFSVAQHTQHHKRAVLYNGQIIDTGALTEQYLNYLIDEEYDVLFVVQDQQNTVAGQKILRRLSQSEQVQVLVLDSGARIRKIQQLHQAIIDFNPACSFLHFLPNDIVGYAAFSKLIGRPRYYIVHNDHTFWIGKGCSDYFLEFRQLGVRTAVDCRGISPEKIVNLPYYPIHSGVPFQGLPFDPTHKVVGLSGALLSKYFRDPELRYFQSIKNLLVAHEHFVFCLCGAGSVSQVEWINRFIRINGLGERFFYLGKRPDFYELVGQVDILFESYPQRGGLVVLFATNQGKAITGIGSTQTSQGTTQQYLDVDVYRQPLSFSEFEDEATRLIVDKDYRNSVAKMLARTKYNKKDFYLKLQLTIEGGFNYEDKLVFFHKVEAPKLQSYNLLMNDEQSVSEFLFRNKIRSYVDSYLAGRLCDVLLTIRFNGLRTLALRIKKKW
jgi:hypothetical protein